MNRFCLTTLCLLLSFFFSVAQPVISGGDSLSLKTFTPAQMKDDFSFLRRMLEKTHPGLYRYTSKEIMQRKMDSVAACLSHDLHYYDFYRILSALIADIRCAHSYIIPKEDINAFMVNVPIIPFDLMPLSGRLYVTLNGTTDQSILPGYELLSVNGKTPGTVLEQIYRHTWSDGYIRAAKVHQATGIRLGLLYYLFIERPDSFDLEFRKPDSSLIAVTVAAQPYKTFSKLYIENPVNKPILEIYLPKNKKDNEQRWRLEYTNDPATACLVFRGFSGGSNSESAARKMRDFMDKNLSILKKKNVHHLIIDLRSNSGGWDSQGVELYNYLTRDSLPFRYYRKGHTVTDDVADLKYSDLSSTDLSNIKKELIPNGDGTFILKEEYNNELKVQQPRANRFKGNIYFLINGGTASAAAEFTAVAQSRGAGIFIGTETAGAYEGGNGGSFLHFHLPNSRFYVGTPLIYYENEVNEPEEKGRGTMPDYMVTSSLLDVLTGVDAQMEFVLRLIKNQDQ